MGKHGKCGKSIIIIIPLTVAVLAAGIFGILRFKQSKNLKKAFNAAQYNSFRVVLSQTITDISKKADEKTASRTLDDVYTLVRQGETYYEKGSNGENYYYDKNGESYVMFFDDNYGRGDGKWIEMANEASFVPMLDISLLEKVDTGSLSKRGKGYIPINGTADETFFTLWQITNTDGYSDISLSFTLNGDKIKTVTAEYTVDKKQKITDTYAFSYDDIKIEIPIADETYGG